ncbi:MAG TPA: IS481 family transposase [Gemmatimonadaceae bacterium]|jgi:transposase InsO family protein|nr:IS481 family transposase [Gemmatimonadaceae bacterium]
MDQRLDFVREAMTNRFTMVELCERYGVSRRIGYKWLARFAADGRRGLADRSRRPHTCPTAVRSVLAELLCEFRRLHPDWGARKLLRVLRDRHPEIEDWPAASTAADLLARRGLVRRRRRRHPHQHPGVVPIATTAPNDLWTADFKGQFRTGNGRYCYPLTIADQHTRFLLSCHGLLSTETVLARPVFERTFREYGLPRAIRTDNGVPFATQAIHGLSHLNVWWMRLGIVHQRIHPGQPQENGAHERMHRTMKRRAIKPVQRTCAGQQRQFDAFQLEYNTERPHEALGQETPASRYAASARAYPARLPVPEYPGHFVVKHVTDAGTFRFQQHLLYIANALVDQWIGLEETDDGVWSIYFNTVLLATLDERDFLIRG